MLDGGSRRNPGPGGSGAAPTPQQRQHPSSGRLGYVITTTNLAEYREVLDTNALQLGAAKEKSGTVNFDTIHIVP
jgi:ribonuclease HI